MMRSILSAALLLASVSAPGLGLAASGTLAPPYNEGRYVDASAPLHGILRDNGSDRAAVVMTVLSTLAVFLIPLYVGLFSERIYRSQFVAPVREARTKREVERIPPRRAA